MVYVFVPKPPVATTVAVPFDPPKQDGETKVALVIRIGAGCVIVAVVVFVQPLPSVAVTVYVFTGKFINTPLVVGPTLLGFGLIVYDAPPFPPNVVTTILPLLAPLHVDGFATTEE